MRTQRARLSRPKYEYAKAANHFDIQTSFNQLMDDIGLDARDTGGAIRFVGADPIFDSRFRIGACISIPIMAAAAGAAIVWRNRTGRGQDLSIDLRKAINGVNTVYKFKPTINGFPYQSPAFSQASPQALYLTFF